MNIANYIRKINNVKQMLRVAIQGKGIDINQYPTVMDYPQAIKDIKMGVKFPNSIGKTELYSFPVYGEITTSEAFVIKYEAFGSENGIIDWNNKKGDTKYYIESSPMILSIPHGVTTIAPRAFASQTSNGTDFGACRGLELPNTLQEIGAGAFSGWIYGGNYSSSYGFNGETEYASYGLTIPDSVKKIGEYAFSHWMYCKKLTLGEGLTNIESGSFFGMSLSDLFIPDNIIEIGHYVFGLAENGVVTIGSGVKKIGSDLYGRSSPSSININAVNPPVIEPDTFPDLPKNIFIYVPNQSVNAYKSAPHWNQYASQIVPKNYIPNKGEPSKNLPIAFSTGKRSEKPYNYPTPSIDDIRSGKAVIVEGQDEKGNTQYHIVTRKFLNDNPDFITYDEAEG